MIIALEDFPVGNLLLETQHGKMDMIGRVDTGFVISMLAVRTIDTGQ